jgi:hypothetical protein
MNYLDQCVGAREPDQPCWGGLTRDWEDDCQGGLQEIYRCEGHPEDPRKGFPTDIYYVQQPSAFTPSTPIPLGAVVGPYRCVAAGRTYHTPPKPWPKKSRGTRRLPRFRNFLRTP